MQKQQPAARRAGAPDGGRAAEGVARRAGTVLRGGRAAAGVAHAVAAGDMAMGGWGTAGREAGRHAMQIRKTGLAPELIAKWRASERARGGAHLHWGHVVASRCVLRAPSPTAKWAPPPPLFSFFFFFCFFCEAFLFLLFPFYR